MAKKNQTPEAELAAYRKARSAGGFARRNNMSPSARSISARYARSFGVGGKRAINPVAEASEAADRILASVKPKRRSA